MEVHGLLSLTLAVFFLSYKLMEVTTDNQLFYCFLVHDIPKCYTHCHVEKDNTY